MPFTLMSWNIESIGEKKLASFSLAQYIANVAFANDVDLLVILEVSPTAASYLINAVVPALQALQDALNDEGGTEPVWMALHAEQSGKRGQLPAVIRPAHDFARGVDREKFFEKMSGCYKRKHEDDPQGEVWEEVPEAKRIRVQDAVDSAVRLNLIKPDQEDYVAFFRCDSTPAKEYGSYWNSVAGIGISYYGSMLQSQAPNGSDLGYQTPGSPINGRMPWRLELTTGTLTGAAQIPLVVYHTIYGTDRNARVVANQRLLGLAVLSGVPAWQKVACAQAAFAILCGDFNVDNKAAPYTQTLPISDTASDAVRVWGYYTACGFTLATNEKSTLLPRDAQQPKSPGESLSYRVNAYDNIAVKASAQGVMTNQGIFDAIADLYTNGFQRAGRHFASMYDAFNFYRRYVSDHLPVVAEISGY